MYKTLERFFSSRMFLIDVYKNVELSDYYFTIEEKGVTHNVSLCKSIIKCSCDIFKEQQHVCKHIKFILTKMCEININRSRSYNSISNGVRVFNVFISAEANIDNFLTDKNPRFKLYKNIGNNSIDSEEVCDICLDKLSNKVLLCKTCSHYFHEECIYNWLRIAVCCNCPLCRNIWS